MRIAVWHNLPSGGGKRALYDQVRGLLERGHEVEAWCPPSADRDYMPLGTLVRERVVPLGFKPAFSLKAKLSPLHWYVPLRLELMKAHCRRVAREINAGSFDLLFSGPCNFFAVPLLARYVRIPSVLYLQEPHRPFYESWPELPWLAPSSRLQDWLSWPYPVKAVLAELKLPGVRLQAREERASAAAFRQILVNSFFSRESVLRAYGIDSKVTYLGIDLERFVARGMKREPVALCVGMLLRQKDPEFLVQAVARVPEDVRPKLVWIANMVDDSCQKKVEQLAAEKGVDFELQFRVSDAELVDILNRARLMLYAPRLEPFGYAPLEANACGLPVVAVAEGGVRESVQNGVNGLLVEHDPDSMATAITRLIGDDNLHSQLSSGALRWVREKWSLAESSRRLEERLLTVVGKTEKPASRERAEPPVTTSVC